MKEITNEYELWKGYSPQQKVKPSQLGPHTSFQLKFSPRHILFSLSRYKFAAKMIGENKTILELGCGDGFGSITLSEFAKSFTGVDFDEEMIRWAKKNLTNEKRRYINDNFLGKRYGQFDAVVSLDVIEHIYPENEGLFFKTLSDNIVHNGIVIVSTPNIETQRFSKEFIRGAHVNLYNAESLKEAMNRFFHNVFIFSMNDEMIHTGYWPMAHCYVALGCYKK
ncbi:MAG: class I SAM-dependent methyltransferase [bacterium]